MEDKILSFLQKIYFPGSVFLGSQSFLFLKTIGQKKKLILTSKLFKESNEKLLNDLFGQGIEYFFQDREPLREDFNNLKEQCLRKSYDYLIAIGGGSVLDLAKITKKELNIKMVAIPTTVGSGAEVSQHVILIDNGVKGVSSSLDFLPEVVILNNLCLKSLNNEQVVFQSIDALSHGLESLVSKISNPLSDIFALSSIETIYESLKELNEQENNDKILEQLQIAGFLAGIAQSSAATGLCHAFAHYFGPKNNIIHSKAVATFLPDILDLNSKHTNKYEKLDCLESLSSSNFILRVRELFDELGVKLEKISISENIEKVAETIKKDICSLTNPYSPDIKDIIEIIKKHQ